jgi:hypothetical protein
MREYYFRRRHLAWGRADTDHRRLKYEIESRGFFDLMYGGLAFMKERDGEQIFNEVSRDLLWHALVTIQDLRGRLPKSGRTLLKELVAETRGQRKPRSTLTCYGNVLAEVTAARQSRPSARAWRAQSPWPPHRHATDAPVGRAAASRRESRQALRRVLERRQRPRNNVRHSEIDPRRIGSGPRRLLHQKIAWALPCCN